MTIAVENIITCTRAEFDALPHDQRFALLSSAAQNATHVIRFHKGRQVWLISFEAVVDRWEQRSNSPGRVRRPVKLEAGTMTDLLDKATAWLLASNAGQKVRWADGQGAGI